MQTSYTSLCVFFPHRLPFSGRQTSVWPAVRLMDILSCRCLQVSSRLSVRPSDCHQSCFQGKHGIMMPTSLMHRMTGTPQSFPLLTSSMRGMKISDWQRRKEEERGLQHDQSDDPLLALSRPAKTLTWEVTLPVAADLDGTWYTHRE